MGGVIAPIGLFRPGTTNLALEEIQGWAGAPQPPTGKLARSF
jgi:hypothetical protein